MTIRATLILLPAFLLSLLAFAQQPSTNFKWPDGKRAALSLSFDDARQSQVDVGVALLDKYKIKATFYVVPSAVERRLEGWKKVVSRSTYANGAAESEMIQHRGHLTAY